MHIYLWSHYGNIRLKRDIFDTKLLQQKPWIASSDYVSDPVQILDIKLTDMMCTVIYDDSLQCYFEKAGLFSSSQAIRQHLIEKRGNL